jgi:hypothetical protein
MIKGKESCQAKLKDGVTQCSFKAIENERFCGRHIDKEEKVRENCQAKLLDGVTLCSFKAIDQERFCGRHKDKEENKVKDDCQAKLGDGVTPCPYGALYNERYCGRHMNKYLKIDEENKVKEELLRIREEREEQEKLMPKIIIPTSEHKLKQLEIIENIDRNDPFNSKLLVVKFPSCVKMIDFDKNKEQGLELDFTKITSGSSISFYWLCPNYIPEHGTFTNPGSKTNCKKIVDGMRMIQGCKICCIDDSRVHDKEEVKKLLNDKSEKKSTTKIGEASELYITNLLLETKKYKDVEKIGNGGGNADIKVTHFDNSFNYLQIKTMTKVGKSEKSFSVRNDDKYSADMLIIFVDNSRNFFALDFYGNLKVTNISLAYNGRSKYKKIMYTDKELLLNKMHELIPFSSKINKISDSYMKEKEMLERFSKFCSERNIEYVRNDTNGNAVDGFINGYSFQAKYKHKDEEKKHIYGINFAKNAGRLNGKFIRKTYGKGEFKFYVVELGGTWNGTKDYKNNFCIIPEEEFIKQGIYESEEKEGRRRFYVCPPDYPKDHWSKKYWNNITPLLNKEEIPVAPVASTSFPVSSFSASSTSFPVSSTLTVLSLPIIRKN